MLVLPERLSDYDGHLVVIAEAKVGSRATSFGDLETREALVSVYVAGGWKSIGEVPIFFRTVQWQIDEAEGEPVGGRLVKGSELCADEWILEPVEDDESLQLLDAWSPEAAESF